MGAGVGAGGGAGAGVGVGVGAGAGAGGDGCWQPNMFKRAIDKPAIIIIIIILLQFRLSLSRKIKNFILPTP